ncbi:MAG: MoaD/ThiS family protein [Fulvivirga sp.]
MTIDILLFGITKDIIGSERYALELEGDVTVARLKEALTSEFPQLTKLKSLLVAVNNKYGQPETNISSKDEIALIPPVSGG